MRCGTSSKKSAPLWIWKAWDRASGQLLDWECGGRDKATCARLIQRQQRWRTRLDCTDDYAVYDVLLPVGQRYAGKDETHGIERDNARQRHWLARFRRRSIVVSKTKRMVDVSLALFARFAGNSRISDLLSMLT
jgi:insertion element IS1 protein InsB